MGMSSVTKAVAMPLLALELPTGLEGRDFDEAPWTA